MGLVAQYLDSRTTQALKCASKTISFIPKQLMRSQFPRRFHVIENGSKTDTFQWDSVYWRDASILQRWNTGEYRHVSLKGSLKCVDENIVIASIPPQLGQDYRYFLMNWNDGSKVWLNTTIAPHKVCIVDSSDTANPISAMLSGESIIEIYRGPDPVSKFSLLRYHFHTFVSCNKKIYIDNSMYCLDDRWSWTKTYDSGKQLLDVNPINDMYIAKYQDYLSMAPHHNIELYSNKQEFVGHLTKSKSVRYHRAKFLDEHQLVCVSHFSIDFADTRKLDKLTASIPTFLNAYTIDPLNRRIINCSKESGLVTIFDLNTRQWTGGFHPKGFKNHPYSFYDDVMHATCRFLIRQEPHNAISALDFQ